MIERLDSGRLDDTLRSGGNGLFGESVPQHPACLSRAGRNTKNEEKEHAKRKTRSGENPGGVNCSPCLLPFGFLSARTISLPLVSGECSLGGVFGRRVARKRQQMQDNGAKRTGVRADNYRVRAGEVPPHHHRLSEERSYQADRNARHANKQTTWEKIPGAVDSAPATTRVFSRRRHKVCSPPESSVSVGVVGRRQRDLRRKKMDTKEEDERQTRRLEYRGRVAGSPYYTRVAASGGPSKPDNPSNPTQLWVVSKKRTTAKGWTTLPTHSTLFRPPLPGMRGGGGRARPRALGGREGLSGVAQRHSERLRVPIPADPRVGRVVCWGGPHA